MFRTGKSTETRRKLVVARVWGYSREGGMGLYIKMVNFATSKKKNSSMASHCSLERRTPYYTPGRLRVWPPAASPETLSFISPCRPGLSSLASPSASPSLVQAVPSACSSVSSPSTGAAPHEPPGFHLGEALRDHPLSASALCFPSQH